MEFLQRNYFETTTAIAVNSNTLTAENLISTDLRRQWVSAGYADDSITAQVTISFDETTTVDRIAILGHNVKSMRIFYNGATANVFSITGGSTDVTTNSATSNYFPVTPVACTSVTFDLRGTISANSEKAVGYIVLSANEYTFTRVPAANNYTPVLKSQEMLHELSDGGLRTTKIGNKWAVALKWQYIDATMQTALKAIYDQDEAKIFVPFGTTTGWDGVIFEATWYGAFDFYKYSDNAVAAGYTGQITLRET